MKIHVVGIGGAGMSAIARLLLAEGHEVSGSDDGRWPLADALVPLGARVAPRFGAQHVEGAQVVLRSSAYGEDNVEVAAALAAGTLVWRRHEAWAHLARGKRVLAVAGTHGKTTTTAMAWSALQAAGIDASLVCGAVLRGLGANAHAGASDVLVIEADEYDRTFLALSPAVAIVTNVEHDHVDQFPTQESYAEAFGAFAARARELVVCADDPGAAAIMTPATVASGASGGGRGAATTARTTYGTGAPGRGPVDAAIRGVRVEGWGSRFTLAVGGRATEVRTAVPGTHNVLNATAALVGAWRLGVPLDMAAAGVASFSGTSRRLERLGIAAGVTVVDDYAHHPTEIRAALAALRERAAGGRLVALFQPHTPSRLAAFGDAFAEALRGADLAFVGRTFPSARERDDDGAGARALAARAGAAYAGDPDEAARALAGAVRPGDVVAVMGAGDIRRAGERLLALLGGATA